MKTIQFVLAAVSVVSLLSTCVLTPLTACASTGSSETEANPSSKFGKSAVELSIQGDSARDLYNLLKSNGSEEVQATGSITATYSVSGKHFYCYAETERKAPRELTRYRCNMAVLATGEIYPGQTH